MIAEKTCFFSFGNITSDLPLQNNNLNNNKYKDKTYMGVADDIKKEYEVDKNDIKGNLDTSKSDKIKNKWKSKEYRYKIISMTNHFKRIYGDNVTLIEYKE